MSPHNTNSAVFGTERIPRLIMRFAIPSIISMTVNSLYNIVDQIFIGQGVGFIGNAATNAAFPFVTFSMALGILIGDGAAAYFSLNLGRGAREASARSVGTALLLAAVVGLAIMAAGLLFTEPLLLLFGATPTALPYAVEYVRITMLGLPFVLVSIAMSSLIRADGKPLYAMICMIVGCVVNIVLDYVFVFVFEWGVAGAAWATVIGQAVNFCVALRYMWHFQTVDFNRSLLRIDWRTASGFLKLGLGGCINQFAITIVVIAMNRVTIHYGALSVYGPDIPLAAQGIVMKVNQIMMAVLIGVSVGMQPIVGFNYGARNYSRVKSAFQVSVLIATLWGCLGFVVFQFFPQYIINLFGQEDALYQDFALKCFRIFLLAIPLFGFQNVATSFFQAIGKPLQASFLALSRQVLCFLPYLFIFSYFFGLIGMLWASPIGDVSSFIVVTVFVVRELKRLNRQIEEQAQLAPEPQTAQ